MEIIAPRNAERFDDAGNCVTDVKLCPNTSFILPDRPPWCLSSIGVQTEKEEERQLNEKENTFWPLPPGEGEGRRTAKFFCRETSVTLGERGDVAPEVPGGCTNPCKDAIARKKGRQRKRRESL